MPFCHAVYHFPGLVVGYQTPPYHEPDDYHHQRAGGMATPTAAIIVASPQGATAMYRRTGWPKIRPIATLAIAAASRRRQIRHAAVKRNIEKQGLRLLPLPRAKLIACQPHGRAGFPRADITLINAAARSAQPAAPAHRARAFSAHAPSPGDHARLEIYSPLSWPALSAIYCAITRRHHGQRHAGRSSAPACRCSRCLQISHEALPWALGHGPVTSQRLRSAWRRAGLR